MDYDVIILGGGAAGLMCARTAGRRGRRVMLLERAEKIGKKILISGGGRCNFTNRHTASENYISDNPHFCKSALARFTSGDFIAMVEEHGIAYHEKTLGQLFCDDSARSIVTMFEADVREAGAEIRTHAGEITVERDEEGFLVHSAYGAMRAGSVVVATGGLSIPKMGATDFGLRLARQFGHSIIPVRPALVPLTLSHDDKERMAPLSGVSCMVRAHSGTAEFRESVLFTHKGLSGPAVLQISSYWKPGEDISLDILPDAATMRELMAERESRMEFKNVLAHYLPKRLADTWTEVHGITKPFYQMNEKERDAVVQQLRTWKLHPAGTEGFDKAEVTAGGVDTRELSSKTMESRYVEGLYFIGEVVDVTGWLGGYNFQWAWSSGWAAGQHV